MFKLRFPEEKISYWADHYSYPGEDRVEKEIAPIARERGFLTWSEFVEMCKWKTPRTQSLVKSNSPEIVEAVTRAALESPRDDVKIGVLRALCGVEWPTLQSSCISVTRNLTLFSISERYGHWGARSLPGTR
jgi:hypothetical protein